MRTRARADPGWGPDAQLQQYGAALAILPVLAARISSHDLSPWYVYAHRSHRITAADFAASGRLRARAGCVS